VSPIFVRPVREQLEHDRLIRFLQLRYKRKLEAAINVGDEQTTPVKIGQATFFPDLVLTDGKKTAGIVEVETGESVNNLEALAQWVNFARARVPFHLYVPVHSYDVARRLSEANQVRPSEIWTYRPTADGFDLVRSFHDPSSGGASARSKKPAPAPKSRSKPARKKAPPARRAKAAKPARKSGSKR
jgi:hypothetical protein